MKELDGGREGEKGRERGEEIAKRLGEGRREKGGGEGK